MWHVVYLLDGVEIHRNYQWYDEVQVRQIIKSEEKRNGWLNISSVKVY